MGTNFVDDDNDEEKGIIPRAIQNIFNEIQKKSENASFSIKASFIEVFFFFFLIFIQILYYCWLFYLVNN